MLASVNVATILKVLSAGSRLSVSGWDMAEGITVFINYGCLVLKFLFRKEMVYLQF